MAWLPYTGQGGLAGWGPPPRPEANPAVAYLANSIAQMRYQQQQNVRNELLGAMQQMQQNRVADALTQDYANKGWIPQDLVGGGTTGLQAAHQYMGTAGQALQQQGQLAAQGYLAAAQERTPTIVGYNDDGTPVTMNLTTEERMKRLGELDKLRQIQALYSQQPQTTYDQYGNPFYATPRGPRPLHQGAGGAGGGSYITPVDANGNPILDAGGNPVRLPAGSKLAQQYLINQYSNLQAPMSATQVNASLKGFGLTSQDILDSSKHQGFAPTSTVLDASGQPFTVVGGGGTGPMAPLAPGQSYDDATAVQITPGAGGNPVTVPKDFLERMKQGIIGPNYTPSPTSQTGTLLPPSGAAAAPMPSATPGTAGASPTPGAVPGIDPDQARAEASQIIQQNPGMRDVVIQRLQQNGIDASGL